MPDHPPDILRHTPPRRLKLVGIIAGCLALAIAAIGLISRVHADQALKAASQCELDPHCEGDQSRDRRRRSDPGLAGRDPGLLRRPLSTPGCPAI
ncbi:MAG: hypothetical protein WDM92_00170 [Caulobacteraceae bacterium]